MASIHFDRSTGWWRVGYFAGPARGRINQPLAKHPGSWSKSKPPKRPPKFIRDLAEPYEEIERQAKRGHFLDTDTPLAPYLAAYVAAYALTKRPNSVACLKNTVNRFLRWCEAHKIESVQGVGIKQCDDWINSRLVDGAKRSTVVTERAYLAPIWVQARKHRLIVENPWELAKVPGKPKEDEIKYWSVPDLKKLFAACEGWVLDFALLAANSGLRVGAITLLKWRHVDFAAQCIRIPAEPGFKTHKPYAVPLTLTASTVLFRRQVESSGGPDDLVFPQTVHGGVISRAQVWRRLQAAVKRAGIPDLRRYPHALRHSFAVALVGDDVSMRLIQELLGHASMNTTQIYAKVSPSKTAEVMARFDITPEE